MNLEKHPELLEQLASAYALGTLRGGARRRFQSLARRSPRVRAAALLWGERLVALTQVEPVAAPPQVWQRIQNLLPPLPERARGRDEPARPSWPGALLWRRLAMGAAALAVAALAVTVKLSLDTASQERELAQFRQQGEQLVRQNQELMAQLRAQPDIRYVAVLSDDKASAFLLALFDPKHNALTVQRVGTYAEDPTRSLQLWALPPAGGPQSLGVLEQQAVLRLPATEQVVGGAPALAISLEPKGGVPGDRGPTGPVLFKGAVLRTPI